MSHLLKESHSSVLSWFGFINSSSVFNFCSTSKVTHVFGKTFYYQVFGLKSAGVLNSVENVFGNIFVLILAGYLNHKLNLLRLLTRTRQTINKKEEMRTRCPSPQSLISVSCGIDELLNFIFNAKLLIPKSI